jgi:hypothetical protein
MPLTKGAMQIRIGHVELVSIRTFNLQLHTV